MTSAHINTCLAMTNAYEYCKPFRFIAAAHPITGLVQDCTKDCTAEMQRKFDAMFQSGSSTGQNWPFFIVFTADHKYDRDRNDRKTYTLPLQRELSNFIYSK